MSTAEQLVARDVSVAYAHGLESRTVVSGVTLALVPNRIVGLAGESGCGKSTLALAMAGYRAPGATVTSGSVEFDGLDLSAAPIRRLRRLWGARIAYMPQDTSTALNPALRVGRQLAETLRTHQELSRAGAKIRSVELLERVGIPEPSRALDRHPYQFSGGQQQRIALAVGLACDPAILILDEPTTGLDVTTQARVNRLIASLVRERRTATLYVSHNLALLATVCDELAIMYGGQIVEHGSARDVFLSPRHPYTAALIAAVPEVGRAAPPHGIPGLPPLRAIEDRCGYVARCSFSADDCLRTVPLERIAPDRAVRCVRVNQIEPGVVGRAPDVPARPEAGGAAELLEARDVRCVFRHRRQEVAALDGVSLAVRSGQTLGIAGESGSGKSTLLLAFAGLLAPQSGGLLYRGTALAPIAGKRPLPVRRAIQIVFQNPDATLNPRHTIRQVLDRPLKLFKPELSGQERRETSARILDRVGLGLEFLDRYPRHLSGGQRQRVALARALVVEPEVILCDEVTSALDVSVQATVLELLVELRDERGLALVFVTHDLGVLSAIADFTVVLEQGVVRETGKTADVLLSPRDPYTMQLLESLPNPRAERGAVAWAETASTSRAAS